MLSIGRMRQTRKRSYKKRRKTVRGGKGAIFRNANGKRTAPQLIKNQPNLIKSTPTMITSVNEPGSQSIVPGENGITRRNSVVLGENGITRRNSVVPGENGITRRNSVVPGETSESNIPHVSEYGLSDSNWAYITKYHPVNNSASNNIQQKFKEYSKKITNKYMQNKNMYNTRNSTRRSNTNNDIELTEEKFARGIRQKIRQIEKYKINASMFTVDNIRTKIDQLSASLDTVFIDIKQIKGSIGTVYHKALNALVTPISKNKKYNIDVLLNGLNNKPFTNEYTHIRTAIEKIKQKIADSTSKDDIRSDIHRLYIQLSLFRTFISNKMDVARNIDELQTQLYQILFNKIDSISNLVKNIKSMI